MQSQQGLAQVDGARFYYEVAGAGEPVVLIHGFSLDTRMWDGQFAILTERYRVIRYDMRGFGRSSAPDGSGYSHAEDLRGLMGCLGLEGAALVGLSLGAAVAIDFALAFPESTRALVLVDPVIIGFDWSPDPVLKAIWSNRETLGVDGCQELWLGHPLFAPARERPEVGSRLEQILRDYSGWHWLNEDPVRYLEPAPSARLGEISVPTLVIFGERDLEDYRAVAQVLHKGIPRSREVVLAGVGHMSNMEAPEEFNEAVSSFLEDVYQSK